MYAKTRPGRKRDTHACNVPLSSRLAANAGLLQLILQSPGGAVSKADLHGLAADLLRQASEAEELEALAGTGLERVA